LEKELKHRLAAHVEYARELGIFSFYRRSEAPIAEPLTDVPIETEPYIEESHEMKSVKKGSLAPPTGLAKTASTDKLAALAAIRADIGDCKRCRLCDQRTNIVFGVGDPDTRILFVGEGPGADEDAQGEPFVGRAGQLLNNMITAMGVSREQIYIANVVKCRPPGNRTPENDECNTCSPFLLRQIEVIAPEMIVALGATAAKTLLEVNEPMSKLRGHVHDFRGTPLIATYHPAYLLRDPRQKGEAWKDLQLVMKHLGMTPPKKSASD